MEDITTPPVPKSQVVVRSGEKIEGLVPTTIQEAWLFCSKMAQSFNLPESYYKMPKNLPDGMNPEDMPNIMDIATGRALQAMQLGMEVGLPPAQSIQSIIVLNGVGTIWGDSQLALVLSSGKSKYVKEYTLPVGERMWMDDKDSIPNKAFTWVCETWRVGDTEPHLGRFSVQDAITAGLWGKDRTWKTHKNRMGMYKARAFCLRDKYADVLKGLSHSVEEMQGEVIENDISHISLADVELIEGRLAKQDADYRQKFLDYMKVSSVESIPASDLLKANKNIDAREKLKGVL